MTEWGASLSRGQTVEDLVRHGRHLKTAPNRVRSYNHVIGLQRDECPLHVVGLVLIGSAQGHDRVAGE